MSWIDDFITKVCDEGRDYVDGAKGFILEKQKELSKSMDVAPEYREAILATACDLLKKYAPDQQSPELLKDILIKAVNISMPSYGGKLTEEQILASGNNCFVQNPGMLNYWAKSKNFSTVTNTTGNDFILTYYQPLAQSFFGRNTYSNYDNNNKHFYSHCKSDFLSQNGDTIVINPEINYNSQVHSNIGKISYVANARSNSGGSLVKGYKPNDAISYVINYKNLGLSKQDVENGAKYVAADINVLDPNIQKSLFSLQNAGFSADDIVKLYVKGVDLTNQDNIKQLTSKNYDINKLTKADNTYKYNLQEYNCAIKPVSCLIFANEYKIYQNRENTNFDANKCRVDLGLPNMYDANRYGNINENFYNNYINTVKADLSNQLRKDYNSFMSQGFRDKIKTVGDIFEKLKSTAAWSSMQALDVALNNLTKQKNTENSNTSYRINPCIKSISK